MVERWAAIAVGLWALGCGGSRLLLGHPVERPLSVLLRMAPDAENGADGGGVAAMVDGMLEALRERGIDATIYAAADEHPPPPRIEVWVGSFDEGDTAVRRGGQLTAAVPVVGVVGAVAYLAGSGSLRVRCRVYEVGKEKPSFDHEYTRVILGDEDAAASAGSSLGSTIIGDVFTDEAP